MSTALLENSIVAGRNKIRTSPLDHRTVSISRLWFAYCANQYSTMFGVDLGKADLKSEQNDTSGRGARARNIYSSARQFQRLESKQNRTYNIIIHFNRRSVSISPLTCLFYRREVSFTIHHKFLSVYITLFQLSTLYSVVYLVRKSKHVCDKVAIFSTSRALKNWQRRAFKRSAWNFAYFWRYIAPQ